METEELENEMFQKDREKELRFPELIRVNTMEDTAECTLHFRGNRTIDVSLKIS